MLRNQKGFTLVELVIVIVIIGILAAIAIPKFADLSNSAKIAACIQNEEALESAQVIYYTNTSIANPGSGSYAADVATLVTAGLVDVAPTCPVDGASSYTPDTDAGGNLTGGMSCAGGPH